jgi:hypothetical protein
MHNRPDAVLDEVPNPEPPPHPQPTDPPPTAVHGGEPSEEWPPPR